MLAAGAGLLVMGIVTITAALAGGGAGTEDPSDVQGAGPTTVATDADERPGGSSESGRVTPTTAGRPPTTSTTSSAPPTTAVPGSESLGSWIVVFASLPVADYDHAAADARASSLRAQGIFAGVLRADDFGSLRPGYWVIYQGPFADAEGTLAVCAQLGLPTPSACYGRPLTQNPDDRAVVAGR